MEELPTKYIVIVDHRAELRDGIEEKIRDVYERIVAIKAETIPELNMVLEHVKLGQPVVIRKAFVPETEVIPRVDMVVIAMLKKDSIHSVANCLSSLNGDMETLDLSLLLDTAPNADILANELIQKRIAELLNI